MRLGHSEKGRKGVYGLGSLWRIVWCKVFVPLLLHERGVKSESFKSLPTEEQEKAVMEELEVIRENHLIRVLQILPYLGLSSNSK